MANVPGWKENPLFVAFVGEEIYRRLARNKPLLEAAIPMRNDLSESQAARHVVYSQIGLLPSTALRTTGRSPRGSYVHVRRAARCHWRRDRGAVDLSTTVGDAE